jgi:hypothetical protein
MMTTIKSLDYHHYDVAVSVGKDACGDYHGIHRQKKQNQNQKNYLLVAAGGVVFAAGVAIVVAYGSRR